MRTYEQLSYQERYKIYRGIVEGKSLRFIAKSIERPPSTVSREVNRNSDQIGYYAAFAQDSSMKRRAKHGRKVTRLPLLKEYVLGRLRQKWSPIAIAGRWNKENPLKTITSEAIYQFIYDPKHRSLELHKLLARRKSKRGLIRKSRKQGQILNRTSIHVRPEHINQRLEVGHFEGDLIFHSESRKLNAFTAVDRKSRFAVILKNKTKNSAVVIEKIGTKLGNLAKSITFDNGTEFAYHTRLTENFGIKTYFCDPGSPWQKGSVENFNAITRRFLPFKIPAKAISQEAFDEIAHKINHIPRKSLDFLTPCEVFKSGLQSEFFRCCTSNLT